jgi:hypothetical protein
MGTPECPAKSGEKALFSASNVYNLNFLSNPMLPDFRIDEIPINPSGAIRAKGPELVSLAIGRHEGWCLQG